MQIIVLGAGAIGSLYGAKLATANDVTLIARAEHAAAMNARGLQIEGRDAGTVRVRAATKVQEIGTETLLVLTTKVSDTAAALAPLAPLIRDDTTILCLQNGLGSEKITRAAIGTRGVVLRGITQFGAIFVRPGVIKFMIARHTLIEQHERSRRIAEVFTGAGLDGRISSNINADVWQKLIFNCVVNPITAILGSEVGAVADLRLDPLKRLLIDECLAVATAEGIQFESDFLSTINEVYAPSHNIASMRQDLMRGRKTEIDYLNGAVVSLGEKHGIDCPVNRSLTTIIKAMEKQSATVPKDNARDAAV
ncbi:MAG: 2-dehydropantoate 2-reductase [Verrucomicrobiota bacterium]|nr:2-dehydropantoate 2-reductase [Verrucomicrobiota bacterium]